jgi:hypothetical protein
MMDEHGQVTEQTTLAPETEVALEVSRRLPLLLLLAVSLTVICSIVCWRRMHCGDRKIAAAPVD